MKAAIPTSVLLVLLASTIVRADAYANPSTHQVSRDTNAEGASSFLESAGFRVGGYGFREEVAVDAATMSEGNGWQACRMNGVGVFARRGINSRFFIEGAVDTYFSDESVVPSAKSSYATPIDRVSGLFSIAAGARAFHGKLISPYAQLGVGLEFTRAKLPELGMEDSALLPMGFIGFGADLRVSSQIHAGAMFRVNAMGYYDDSQFQTELSPTAELATQGQFFLALQL